MHPLAHHLLAAWLLLLACVPSAHAQGVIDMGGMPEQESKAHFKVGKSLYESGRFAEAAAEWNRAFELSQRVELLYNVYVAYRDASDVPRAIDALRRYLQAAELDDATRQNLQARLRAMEEANAKGPAVTVTPSDTSGEPSATEPVPAQSAPPASEPPPPEPEPAPAPAAATGSSADDPSIAPYVLLGVGGALVIGAAITGAIVLGNEKDLEDGCPDQGCRTDETIDKLDSTKTLAVVTDVLWISGVVAAGMGTALLLFGGEGDGERDSAARSLPVASLGCAPGGCSATLRGRF
jgi:tetratricopeptide (TPR) repeat protein